MAQRLGHRVRWSIVWVLLAAWLVALVFGLGGGAANAVLVVALLVLSYELLAADGASGRS
ncbi:MAG: hypothetical protein KGJ98_03940 [Chloroflexota bacterium]|nr:hypothetical protein [Chloroflexota bacterium]MDE3101366.1 hypothetical protein [Chloroflexota bacterium]